MRDLHRPYPFGIDGRTWPWFALGALVLVALAFPFDRALSVAGTGLPDPIRAFFFAVTDIGLSEWILVPALVLFLITALLALAMRSRPVPHRALVQMSQLYAFIFIGVGFPGLVASIIKRLVGRGRPEVYDTSGAFGFESIFNDWTHQSFVSGHTVTIVATAFVIGFLSPRWFWPALAVAAIVGVSRVIVGAHYPSDVIGGAIVGALGVYLVRNAFASRRILFEPMPDGTIRLRPFAAVKRLARRRDRTTR
jgi:membrane-associated phospholipid phosphatase